MKLAGKIALVTGGSRGVGRGIARGLGEAGVTVYLTGRTCSPGPEPEPGTIEHVAAEVDRLGGRGIPVRCDHGDDAEIARLFSRIETESKRLDILVNNVHSGIAGMAETAHRRFWEDGPETWDGMNRVGLRGHYVASVHGARIMARQRSGLIVNVSSFGAITYLFTLPYGVGKAALDRMTADMALELREFGVAVVSVWPGLVRTEFTAEMIEDATPVYRRIYEAYAETPLVTGRAVAALASDPKILRRTGRVAIAGEVARRFGLRDEDGSRPRSPRSVRTLVEAALPPPWTRLAVVVPPVRFPLRVVALVLRVFSRFLKKRGGDWRRSAGPD